MLAASAMPIVPKPLDVQLAEERSRHPTVREAARAGFWFGLISGLVTGALQLAMHLVPSTLPVHAPVTRALPAVFASTLVGSIVTAIVFFELGAAIIRWRRRSAVQGWYPKGVA
jgi:hypothetical protein